MMPQFNQMRNKVLNYKNFAVGIYLFAIGFAKKVAIADTFAVWANHGFDVAQNLTLLEAWATSLSYTLQLYFDFSGYTDMALGSALMFNIKLPINFNSPYRALDIQDFWRRWHITLTRFLRDYIYIPLGGNRVSLPRNLENLMITFLLGGLWHGAGWTFIFWGFLHGSAMALHRLWTRLNFRLPQLLAWFLTFNFVNFAWIFFRAKNWDDALKVAKGMLGLNGVVVSPHLAGQLAFLKPLGLQFGNWMGNIQGSIFTIWAIAGMLAVAIFWKNSNDMAQTFKPSWVNAIFVAVIVTLSMLNTSQTREFLYFNF
jgi:D-alanyl-lipoteichoic acid acyltransferase DltB (MBOAT superfamily)